jgi:hypothetical protein
MGVTGLWDWVRGIGIRKHPDDEAVLREEFGGEDPGEAEEEYLPETGYAAEPIGWGGGLAMGEAAELAKADLDETKPPRDPAP